jgi:hypothetical protein
MNRKGGIVKYIVWIGIGIILGIIISTKWIC